ncbi:MAG: hypothetical protein ACYS9X_05490 [Planctomycetota bacterium]|jgi:hypothetical protein
MRAARITGTAVLVLVALPALACGVYAVASWDSPENLPAWFAASEHRMMGFTILGVASCVVGAATLALSLALIVWPGKALGPHAPLGRALGRLLRRRGR